MKIEENIIETKICDKKSQMDIIPEETIFVMILQYLPNTDILRFKSINRYWLKIIQQHEMSFVDNNIIKNITCYKKYGNPLIVEEGYNLRKIIYNDYNIPTSLIFVINDTVSTAHDVLFYTLKNQRFSKYSTKKSNAGTTYNTLIGSNFVFNHSNEVININNNKVMSVLLSRGGPVHFLHVINDYIFVGFYNTLTIYSSNGAIVSTYTGPPGRIRRVTFINRYYVVEYRDTRACDILDMLFNLVVRIPIGNGTAFFGLYDNYYIIRHKEYIEIRDINHFIVHKIFVGENITRIVVINSYMYIISDTFRVFDFKTFQISDVIDYSFDIIALNKYFMIINDNPSTVVVFF